MDGLIKETFIIRTEWYNTIVMMNECQRSIFLINLFRYHLNEPIDTSDMLVNLVWTLIEPNLHRNIVEYDKRRDSSAINGAKGGRPATQKKPNNNLNKPKKPIETLYDSVSVIVSDSVSESDSVSVNIPTRQELLSFCSTLDIDYEALKETIGAKYDTWYNAGWKNGYGTQITDWKQTIINTLPHLKPMPKKQATTTLKAKGNFGAKKGGANE